MVLLNSNSKSKDKKTEFLNKIKSDKITWDDIHESTKYLSESDTELFRMGVEHLEKKGVRDPKEINEKRDEIISHIRKDLSNKPTGPDLSIFPQYYEIFNLFKERGVLKKCNKCDGIGFRIWELNPQEISLKCQDCQSIQTINSQKCRTNGIGLKKLMTLLDVEINQYPEFDMSETEFPKYSSFTILSSM